MQDSKVVFQIFLILLSINKLTAHIPLCVLIRHKLNFWDYLTLLNVLFNLETREVWLLQDGFFFCLNLLLLLHSQFLSLVYSTLNSQIFHENLVKTQGYTMILQNLIKPIVAGVINISTLGRVFYTLAYHDKTAKI